MNLSRGLSQAEPIAKELTRAPRWLQMQREYAIYKLCSLTTRSKGGSMKRKPLLVSTIAILFLSAPALGIPMYNVVDLGTPGIRSVANAINDKGEVVGAVSSPDGSDSHAFVYRDGRMQDLNITFPNSAATAINDNGAITGRYNDFGINRAFTYDNASGFMPLPSQGWGQVFTNDINNQGRVVGVGVHNNQFRAFQSGPGASLTDLGTLGGPSSRAEAINEAGTVVGAAALPNNGGSHAFLYNGQMIDLGTLGGMDSIATDINDKGQIVGASTLRQGGVHAFVYENGRMTDLGNFGSGTTAAQAINNNGVIVGDWFIGNTGRGFIYDGSLHNLNDLIDPLSDWQITQALDINDLGQIAVFGCDIAQCHALRLDPITTAEAPIPGTALLLLSALAIPSLRQIGRVVKNQ